MENQGSNKQVADDYDEIFFGRMDECFLIPKKQQEILLQ